ncbi:autotransporter assembly complex protein TamA [Maritalea myrionectae]|uniref:autotransporter assembly complex protein TamA n=1 Tax=Maritalea myrionectae TaxID=454601 RepID=UPI0012EBE90C|nr:autotransporter assembly complex family protein [Maritalea myrionectae]
MSNLVRMVFVGVSLGAALSLAAAPAFAFDFGQLWPFGGGEARVSNAAEVTPVAGEVRYATQIQVDKAELEQVIADASLLVGDQGEAPEDSVSLLTRAQVDQKRIVAALYGEAHYGAVLTILIDGVPLDQVPLDINLQGKVAQVTIQVDAGSQFVFSAPDVRVNDQPLVVADYGLRAGETAKSDAILSAQNAIMTEWREKGYAFAEVVDRTIEADHSVNQLDVLLRIETGQLAHIGDVRVSGAKDMREDTIIEIADLPRGEIYRPQTIKRATRDLQELGVFNSVVIKRERRADRPDLVDLVIEVSERKPRTIGVGATIGNTDGLGVEGFWVHRNLFGGAEKVRVEGSVNRIGQGGLDKMDFHTALVYFKPNAFGPKTSFEGKISFDIENPKAFTKRGGKIETSLSHQINDDLSVRGGLTGEYAVLTVDGVTTNQSIISAPFELTYDTRDNSLNPTEGFFAVAYAEPTYAIANQAQFIKTSVKASTYYAFDDEAKLVLAGRVAAGSIIGADLADVPVDRRFFAGGAGSIRGYAFQAAGPRTLSGNPSGGLSFLETSVEARYRVTEQIGVVGFVDMGGAFTSSVPGQGGDLYTGVGVGVRYLTPLGPIRADLAIPLKNISGEPNYGLYLGIGQAF